MNLLEIKKQQLLYEVLHIKTIKLFIIFLLLLCCLSSVLAIGISPAKKTLMTQDSYTIKVVGKEGAHVEMRASPGVVLSGMTFVLDETGEKRIRVDVDFSLLIPGENILEVVALEKNSQSGQITVQTEVVHKLTVYKDSDEDYIKYKTFVDYEKKSLGVYGKVLSTSVIDKVDLLLSVAEKQTVITKEFVNPDTDFELSTTFDDLQLPKGYYVVDMKLTYGEKSFDEAVPFIYGAPSFSSFRAKLKQSGEVSLFRLLFNFDWNREQNILSNEVFVSKDGVGLDAQLAGGVLMPGNNTLELFVADELNPGTYVIKMNITTDDGVIQTSGSLTILEKNVGEETNNTFIRVVLVILLVILLAYIVYEGKKEYIKLKKKT